MVSHRAGQKAVPGARGAGCVWWEGDNQLPLWQKEVKYCCYQKNPRCGWAAGSQRGLSSQKTGYSNSQPFTEVLAHHRQNQQHSARYSPAGSGHAFFPEMYLYHLIAYQLISLNLVFKWLQLFGGEWGFLTAPSCPLTDMHNETWAKTGNKPGTYSTGVGQGWASSRDKPTHCCGHSGINQFFPICCGKHSHVPRRGCVHW